LNTSSQYIDFILLGLLAFFIYPMARITMQYIPYNTDVGFLQIKQEYIDIDFWRGAFFIHVYSSFFVLAAGFTQFSKQLLKIRPTLHRKLGYAYVLNILCITGPASLIMGFYANGGIYSRIGFVLLSILWLWFTYNAVSYAKQKKFKLHKAYMIRSFALTLSAITLRAWKYAITNTWELPPMDVYRMIAWLGWGVNLIVAEIYIRKKLQHH
jgi:uncharacterized membrane protein